MTVDQFVPQYDETVTETNTAVGDSSTQSIGGKGYALLVVSARCMMKILNEGGLGPVTMSMAAPWPSGGPFVFNKTVPWLNFPNGQSRNAGELGTYWGMPGLPPSSILAEIKDDINTPVGV